MLAGETYVFIAKTLGVHPRTVRRWMDEPEFSAQLKMEYDSLAKIIRTQHHVQTLKSGEMSLEASRFLHHVMTADGSALPARMRAAGQLMNYSFKQMVHAQKTDKEGWATPIKGLREHHVERQVNREVKAALKAEAATPEPAQSGQSPAPCQTPATSEVPSKSAPQTCLPEELVSVSSQDCIHALAKVDKTGQKRTSASEHAARRERLKRIDREHDSGRPPQAQVA